MLNETAKVTVRDVTMPDGSKQDVTKDYQKIVMETSEDMLAELSRDEKGTIELWNYAKDLKLRAAVRSQVLSEVAGPGKAIDKAVEAFMKARAAVGKPVTEEQAKQILGL